MIRIAALATVAVVSGAIVLAAAPSAQRATTARAQVHCPNGNAAAFVTPPVIRIALGDSVEWNMAGPVPSDSIIITPKDTAQAWPFEGTPSRGGPQVRANRATIGGTYSYNISMVCRVQGGGLQRVTIDPDIIIEG